MNVKVKVIKNATNKIAQAEQQVSIDMRLPYLALTIDPVIYDDDSTTIDNLESASVYGVGDSELRDQYKNKVIDHIVNQTLKLF